MGGGGGGMQYQPPPLEPLKSAEDTIKEATTRAGRDQQLRRGLAASFSRSTMGKGATGSSATSGGAKKLGA